MLAKTYITIQEASDLSGKSIQTIRRALKSKKVLSRRRSTPQGFNYVINKQSVIDYYKLRIDVNDREPAGLGRGGDGGAEAGGGYVSAEDIKGLRADLGDLLAEQNKIKTSLVGFMKAFQDRFMMLENQMKLLEEPKKKWFEFWKK